MFSLEQPEIKIFKGFQILEMVFIKHCAPNLNLIYTEVCKQIYNLK